MPLNFDEVRVKTTLYPPKWMPKFEDEEIILHLVEVNSVEMDGSDGTYDALSLTGNTEYGSACIFNWHGNFMKLILKLKPAEGDTIKVVYKGVRPGKGSARMYDGEILDRQGTKPIPKLAPFADPVDINKSAKMEAMLKAEQSGVSASPPEQPPAPSVPAPDETAVIPPAALADDVKVDAGPAPTAASLEGATLDEVQKSQVRSALESLGGQRASDAKSRLQAAGFGNPDTILQADLESVMEIIDELA